MQHFEDFYFSLRAIVEEWGFVNVVLLMPESAEADNRSQFRTDVSTSEELIGFAVEVEGTRYLTKEYRLADF
jgi:hypothetical protein